MKLKWVKTCTEEQEVQATNTLFLGPRRNKLITCSFPCRMNTSHFQNTCHFIACYRHQLPSCVSPPRGEACVNICIPSRKASLRRLLAMCFFACKQLEVCAKGSRWPNSGVPDTSTSVGPCQNARAPLRSAYLITHSFIRMIACQLRPNTQQRFKRGSIWCCCNPAALE